MHVFLLVAEASSVNVFKNRLDDWIQDVDFKASASRPLHLQVASYKLQVTYKKPIEYSRHGDFISTLR